MINVFCQLSNNINYNVYSITILPCNMRAVYTTHISFDGSQLSPLTAFMSHVTLSIEHNNASLRYIAQVYIDNYSFIQLKS